MRQGPVLQQLRETNIKEPFFLPTETHTKHAIRLKIPISLPIDVVKLGKGRILFRDRVSVIFDLLSVALVKHWPYPQIPVVDYSSLLQFQQTAMEYDKTILTIASF